jgi:hypothetical protein
MWSKKHHPLPDMHDDDDTKIKEEKLELAHV